VILLPKKPILKVTFDDEPHVIFLLKKPALKVDKQYIPDDELDYPRFIPSSKGPYSKDWRAHWLFENGFARDLKSAFGRRRKSTPISTWTSECDKYDTDSESESTD
jgi:hypothetical protein